ncbi:MAG TPA: GNAT family N-acetyltransferase [Gemmatimonadaceae bacterium]
MATSTDRQDRNVSLRRAEASDARLLAQLGARLFERAFGSSTTPQDMAAYLASAFSVEIQSAELADPDRVTWIAEDAGKAAVGYLMLRRGTRSNGVTAVRPAELQRIYVDPTVQGQRVGESLVNACIEQAIAWHCDELWLGVWDQNARAIEFYRRMGFREVGTQTFSIGSDEQSDFVMSRTLMP